jgi:hypothetical protein
MGYVIEVTFKSMLLTDDDDATMFRRVKKIFENTKNLGEIKQSTDRMINLVIFQNHND